MSGQTISVKLLGGPMHGRSVDLPRGSERFSVGKIGAALWTYTYAGKDGRQVLFALQPRNRAERKFVHWFVGKLGRDPRVETAKAKSVPFRLPRDKSGRKVRPNATA